MPVDDSYYTRPHGVKERLSAGGVVVRWEKGRILVAITHEPGFGPYILPKGGVKKRETIEQAARREIQEEAGFTELEELAYLGIRERLGYTREYWITTHYYLYRTTEIAPRPTDRYYDYEVDWYELDALPEMLWPDQQQLIEDNRELIRSRMG
jgi:ADP-ribose pyrophosphatase YjhB (NUDIX family)